MTQKITAVSFVYNEIENIRECMKNLSGKFDEILVVDMDSTDGTLEVLHEYTNRIYRKPHLICGDQYKEFLSYNAQGDWLLWFYPDERFSDAFFGKIRDLVESQDFDAYALMRQEYRDGIRLMPHGTKESPNYQSRLHRRGRGIFYTELVHAELHGMFRPCPLPEEFYMEHRKTNNAQEFDNYRTYCEMKHLVWKYRDTNIQPFKNFCDSYRKIIFDSEAKNKDGSRNVHRAEEHWWHWWEHKDEERIPLDQFLTTVNA